MSGTYPGDPQIPQWQRHVVDPSLPLNRQEVPGGYPPPTTMAQQQSTVVHAAPGQNGGFATSSLVLGIVGVSLGWIPVCGIVSLAPSIIGVVLGCLGLRSTRHRYVAIAGIILSVIGVALAMLIAL
jgi:hypothetical protein